MKNRDLRRRDLSILVEFSGTMAELASLMGPVVGMTFLGSDRVKGASLWARSGDYGMGIMDISFPEPFDLYTFLVDFGVNVESREYDYARSVFEKLKALGLPMMLFANGCDIELDRYDPPSPAA